MIEKSKLIRFLRAFVAEKTDAVGISKRKVALKSGIEEGLYGRWTRFDEKRSSKKDSLFETHAVFNLLSVFGVDLASFIQLHRDRSQVLEGYLQRDGAKLRIQDARALGKPVGQVLVILDHLDALGMFKTPRDADDWLVDILRKLPKGDPGQ